MKKDMTSDMTVGNPVKLIIWFMIPMFLGNVFQQFYNIADSIVAGQFIGVDALAAIGSTGSLMFFVTGWLNGMSSGFAIIVSQMFGAKKYDDMRQYVAMSVYLMFGITAVMTVGLLAFNEPILRLMNSPEELMGDVKAYMGIIYAGLIVTAAYNALAAFLRALGDSKSPLYFLIISAAINVVLDVVFIVPFGMDVAGAAWATVLAQAISAALCIVFALKRFTILHFSAREWRFSAEAAWRHLKVGFPMGFQMSVMCIGQLAMQAAVNRIGTSAIAGYTAANKVDQLSVLVDNAVGIGIANYVAQNYGAGKMDRIKKGVWHCFLMLTAMNFAMGALLLLGQSFVVPMFVTNPTAEIMQYSKDYLFTVVPFYFFLGALLVYRTAIQSVGNTWAPFAACVIELAARILCASVLSIPFGYRAVCFATPFAWLTALSLLIPVYIVLIRKLVGGQSTQTKA